MSDIRFEGWLHKTGTGGVYQDAAGNVGIASTQPKTRLDIGNGGFQVGPTGIATVTTVNTTNLINATQLSHRNLIINGAMNMAQRGTSSTSSGLYTVDRFKVISTGVDESPTQAQVDVASGTTPYTSGFRKALKVTNGNQTSGAGAGDYIWIQTILEAQNIANSGWNYTSSSSYVTLSFWVKSSVAQDFKGYLRSRDGTNYEYPFATGSLSADTWTKITKTIPGNSNITINNDNEAGFEINLFGFLGTNRTDGSATEDAWATYNSSQRTKNNTTTWYTTNDATLEVTGYQLEVGSVATPFEHRSFGEELELCRRYYYDYIYKETSGGNQYGTTNANRSLGVVMGWAATEVDHPVKFPTPMRTAPSLVQSTGSNYFQIEGGGASSTYVDGNWTLQFGNVNGCNIYATPDTNVTSGNIYHGVVRNTSAQISFEAEL